ncbi:3594_t:CDS:2 [Dentiscutata erythropus]|uniref:3594_t:CDS:1 n=1 Tax=Dentiscutata erythropus TaxID=1348616 RepID=A0A9N9AAK9_9GLOM|nr:3594_t:CDS:2 [Dentiscutata erythropus]
MEATIIIPETMSSVSCVDASYRLIDEIKHITINLRNKKIFDPIIHPSSETVRTLHYAKNEVESYSQQYEDAFNKYKVSLENVKEFAKEIGDIEKSHYFFYPYRHVKEKYEKLLKEHENCEKILHPILIKIIMNKQERQQEDIMNFHKVLKTIPGDIKSEKIIQIEKIVQNLIERSVLDINVPRIDSILLFDPPHADDSKINHENEPDGKPECDLDDYNENHISNHIMSIINWSAPEIMQNNALYTQECEVFSFIMLLWELAFQKIPYENMNKEDIIAHVTRGRRESPKLPFFTLDYLNIQRKYLRIIADGWDGKPEKRIGLDEILLRFSEIEAEIIKLKRNNLGSDGRSIKTISNPPTPKFISDYKRHSIHVRPKESLASNLESVNEVYTPYTMKTQDSFMISPKTWKRPSNIEPSNIVNPLPPRLSIMSNVVEAPDDISNSSEKYKEIISKQKEDGSIGLDDSVCNELDVPKKDILNTIKKNITNKKLKLPEFSLSFETAINLSYLKNVTSQHESVWRDKYNKAREYLSKQIGDTDAEKELLECVDKYIVDKATDKVTEKHKEDIVTTKKDGSSLFTKLIGLGTDKNHKQDKEPEKKNEFEKKKEPGKIKGFFGKLEKEEEPEAKARNSPTISKDDRQANILTAMDNEKAIRNNNQENIYAPKLDSTEEALYEDLRSSVDVDVARIICNTQREDGSFTLDSSITDHLDIKLEEVIKSLKRLAISPRLRECDDSVWHTAFTIYYLKTIIINYENEWRNAYDRASKWLFKQINDTKLEKELFSACKQYLIEQGYRSLYSTKKDIERFKILRLKVDDETRKAVFDDLRSNDTTDLARSLCSSQIYNGSFSQNALTILHPLIPSPANAVESLKRFVSSTKLRTCVDSIWYTAFTIYYFKNVLIDHEKEWRHAYDRAGAWITEQIDNAGAEKELYSACEQYLIQQGVDFINSQSGIEEESEESFDVIVLQISEETRKTVRKSLRDYVTEEVARTLCNSQEPNGSFTLHKSISDHLRIPSVDNAVKSLKPYVGSSFLRSCDPSLWCTALTITYLRTVLDNYEQVWKPACERATSWINQQCKNPEMEEELYSACDQFLIKQGIEVLNEQSRQSRRQSMIKGEMLN